MMNLATKSYFVLLSTQGKSSKRSCIIVTGRMYYNEWHYEHRGSGM